jgi:hypothetical protein
MSRDRPPELRLATLCAGTAEARAASRGAARELIETVDWTVLEDALRERRLLALLASASFTSRAAARLIGSPKRPNARSRRANGRMPTYN